MSTIRYTLEFTRDLGPNGVQVIPAGARVATGPVPEPTMVSVTLLAPDATFEKAVEYAFGFLPQGPTWKAPRLVSIIESDD